eukprot:4470846-Heterocapsa_arctica.AAC.1
MRHLCARPLGQELWTGMLPHAPSVPQPCRKLLQPCRKLPQPCRSLAGNCRSLAGNCRSLAGNCRSHGRPQGGCRSPRLLSTTTVTRRVPFPSPLAAETRARSAPSDTRIDFRLIEKSEQIIKKCFSRAWYGQKQGGCRPFTQQGPIV